MTSALGFSEDVVKPERCVPECRLFAWQVNPVMFNGTLFQQTLQDLVKGLRAHRRDEASFIREKLAEIAGECRSKDLAVKTNAVLKLTHLQMLGCNMSFASFYIVEVMCASDFSSKRIGYLAAAQSFSPTTDVLLLTTNQFKKDLTNGRMQDCSQALACLSKIATESLACDLNADVTMLLSSPRPYIRKKTLLVLYRFITVYPETLGMISDKFRKCLDDPDPGVVCAAVTVTCELARTSPRDFLGLAPALYSLLTTSSNNWMLIKIVKLMGVLTPLEPRLGKKLVGPLTNLMRTTRAKSLLYECCCTVTLGLMDQPEAVQLCGERLSEFMVDLDQNLKYLGLLSMRRLANAHPSVAMQHRDLILDCLDDEDIGIRMRALELVSEFVTRRTLRDITRILLRKLKAANVAASFNVTPVTTIGVDGDVPVSEAAESAAAAATLLLDPETPFRDALAEQLLTPGNFVPGEGYPILTSGDDFAWYIATVLGGLARTTGVSRRVADTVASQLTELISRVEAVRPATVAVAAALLGSSLPAKRPRSGLHVDPLAKAPSPGGQGVSLIDDTGDDPVTGEQTPSAGISVGPESGDSQQAEISVEESESGEHPSGEVSVASSPTVDASHISNGDTSQATGAGVSASADSVAPLSSPVAGAAAWVLGEHAELLSDRQSVIDVLLEYPVDNLSCSAQVAILGSLTKLLASCEPAEAQSLYGRVLSRLERSLLSDLAEVCERAVLYKTLVEVAGPRDVKGLRAVFEGKLLPVDAEAQADVPVPDGLDLNEPLLDTGGLDLYTFLAGDTAYVDDNLDAMSGHVGVEDELFEQLKERDDIFNGAGGTAVQVVAGEHSDATSSSPFHLGPRDEESNGDIKVSAAGVGLAGSELLGVGGGNAVGLLSGDDTPVNVLVGRHDGGVPSGSKKKKPKSKKSSVQEPVPSKYGNAFEGLFDGPSAATGSNVNEAKDPGAKKKKKKKKKKSSEKHDSGGVAVGDPNGKGSSAVNLIDFDGAVEAEAAKQDAPVSKVPAHIGQTDDLLL